MNDVEWGKEAAAATDGLKCNFNMILCAVRGEIPGQNGGVATIVERKLYFPKTTVGVWIKKHLTTAHIKYKTIDKIVSSEPSQYKVDTLSTCLQRYWSRRMKLFKNLLPPTFINTLR